MYVCNIIVRILGLSHAAYVPILRAYVHMAYVHTGVLCLYKSSYICTYLYIGMSIGSAGGGLSRSCPQASPVDPESEEEQNCKFAVCVCADHDAGTVESATESTPGCSLSV